MNNCSMNRLPGLTTVAAAIAGLLAVCAGAATLPDIFAVAERINQQAKASQAKVDALAEETRDLYDEFRTTQKEIEGLRVYNRQLQRRIDGQERKMAQINENIGNVTNVQRQVTPLMERMLIGLRQFIENDMPFFPEERQTRLDTLRHTLDRPDVTASEQFSQVMNAYQIEIDYGSALETYSDEITVNGNKRVADILLVGRIALVYQTADGKETGYWNKEARRWEVLDDSYQAPVRNGIRMARDQATPNLLPVPIKVED